MREDARIALNFSEFAMAGDDARRSIDSLVTLGT